MGVLHHKKRGRCLGWRGPILISRLKKASLIEGGAVTILSHPKKAACLEVIPSWRLIPKGRAGWVPGEWPRSGASFQKELPAWRGVPVWGRIQRQPHSHQTDTPHSITITPDIIPSRPLPSPPLRTAVHFRLDLALFADRFHLRLRVLRSAPMEVSPEQWGWHSCGVSIPPFPIPLLPISPTDPQKTGDDGVRLC